MNNFDRQVESWLKVNYAKFDSDWARIDSMASRFKITYEESAEYVEQWEMENE